MPGSCRGHVFLVAALRAYPPNVDKRWDLVAAKVPTRTKQQVMSKVKVRWALCHP